MLSIRLFLTVLLAFLLAPASASAQSYPYLTDAINKINEIYYKSTSPSLSSEGRLQIATIACHSLTHLLEDSKEFSSRTNDLFSKSLRNNRDEVRKLLSNVSQMDAFIETERKVLESEKFDFLAMLGISNSAATSARNAASFVGDLTAGNVISQIRKIQAVACSFQKESMGAYRTEMLRHGIFGVGLVAVDGAASIPAPFMAASAAIGGEMIYKSAEALLK